MVATAAIASSTIIETEPNSISAIVAIVAQLYGNSSPEIVITIIEIPECTSKLFDPVLLDSFFTIL